MFSRLRAVLVLEAATVVLSGALLVTGCGCEADDGSDCGPAVKLTPEVLTFQGVGGGPNPPSQPVVVTITSGVGSVTSSSQLNFLRGLVIGPIDYHNGPTGWLQTSALSPMNANPERSFTVQTVPGTLPAKTYTAGVTINSPSAVGAVLEVTLVVSPSCSTIDDQFGTASGWTTSATTSGAAPTHTVRTEPDLGNPGGYRQMEHLMSGIGSISVYHDYTDRIYDPSVEGPIHHINYFEDQRVINPPFAGAAVGAGFTLTQDGTRYHVILRPPGGAFTNTTWEQTQRVTLTAVDFGRVNFTGGPITFGYFRSNSNTGGGKYTVTHGIDNWKVEVCR